MAHAIFELMMKFCFVTIAAFLVLAIAQTFVRNFRRRSDVIDFALCTFGVGMSAGGCGLLGDALGGFTHSPGISAALGLYAMVYGASMVVSQMRSRRQRQELMKRFDDELK